MGNFDGRTFVVDVSAVIRTEPGFGFDEHRQMPRVEGVANFVARKGTRDN